MKTQIRNQFFTPGGKTQIIDNALDSKYFEKIIGLRINKNVSKGTALIQSMIKDFN